MSIEHRKFVFCINQKIVELFTEDLALFCFTFSINLLFGVKRVVIDRFKIEWKRLMILIIFNDNLGISSI